MVEHPAIVNHAAAGADNLAASYAPRILVRLILR
jgi:hypothetical protein